VRLRCCYRWQEHLWKDPSNFETLEEIPGVMGDVLKAQVNLSDQYMNYMAKHLFSLKRRR
jgi:hypothetical protein